MYLYPVQIFYREITLQQQINYNLYCLFKDHYLRHTIIHETILKEIVCHRSFIYFFIKLFPNKLRLPHCIILYNILHNTHYTCLHIIWIDYYTEFKFFKYLYISHNYENKNTFFIILKALIMINHMVHIKMLNLL